MTQNLSDALTGEVIGQRLDGSPILLHFGGAGEVTAEPDDGDDEPDADEGDEDGQGDGKPDDYTPPDRQQWERMQAAVRRNNAENRNLRQLRKTLTGKGIDLSTDEGRAAFEKMITGGGDGTKAAPDKAATDRAVERAVAKTEAQYRGVLGDIALKAALADAGWSGKSIDRVRRQIDFDDFEIVDGQVVGIAEQVDQLKAEIPEWFQANKKPAEPRRGAREVDGGNKETKPTGASKGWLQQVDDQMTGKTR